MKILVTGASGFVGGSFLQRFSQRSDINIHGIARRAMPWKNYTRVDLTKDIDLAFKPDVVIHAAAHVSPWGKKAEFYKKNILATQNIIEFCKHCGNPKLIYISSSSVFYRDEPQSGLTEASPIGPTFINDYAATKYAGEQCVSAYEGEHVILRPRAIFGPGDTVLFPRLLTAAKKERLPLFRTPSPVIGDLIYIDCLIEYILYAAQNNHIQGSYNLTNAEPVDIQALLISVLSRLGIAAPKRTVSVGKAMIVAGIIEGTYRFLGISREPPITRYGVSVLAHSKTFDVSKMLADFGQPSMTINQGIDKFIDWQLHHA